MQTFLKYFFYLNITAIISVVASAVGDASFPIWGTWYGLAPLGAIDLIIVAVLKMTKLIQKHNIPNHLVKRILIVGSIEILVGLAIFVIFVISLQNFSLI